MSNVRKDLTVDFDGFDELLAIMKQRQLNVKGAVEEALEETHAYITPNLHREMYNHHITGDTEASIVDEAEVRWVGDIASVSVGFDIANGGLPSIFLMYGTPRRKKSQVKPYKELYDALYGTATKKKIRAIQEDVFFKYL